MTPEKITLKLVSKIDCKQCTQVKNYLEGKSVQYELEMAEDKGYGFWREFIAKNTGVVGFPILIKDWGGGNFQVVNGLPERIIEEFSKWETVQDTVQVAVQDKCDHPDFDWCFCKKCGHNVKEVGVAQS